MQRKAARHLVEAEKLEELTTEHPLNKRKMWSGWHVRRLIVVKREMRKPRDLIAEKTT